MGGRKIKKKREKKRKNSVCNLNSIICAPKNNIVV